MRPHPDIACVGGRKEPLYFNTDSNYPFSMLCNRNLTEYHRLVGAMRYRYRRLDLRIGDWSATYFTCLCCPAVLKGMNPGIKVVLLLRDPIQRALSRFQEQKAVPRSPLYYATRRHTFASYVDEELAALEDCVARAARYRRQRGASAAFPIGWAVGMDLGTWMEAQCYEHSNILGWSVYDLFLENYLAHIPQKQILVLYTDELAADPLTMVRKVESHLGLAPATYNLTALKLVYNSHGCYAWKCAQLASRNARSLMRSSGHLLPAGDSARRRLLRAQQPAAATQAALAAAQQRQLQEQQDFARAAERLVAFYRPHMQRLFKWADERRIAPVPAAWRQTYA